MLGGIPQLVDALLTQVFDANDPQEQIAKRGALEAAQQLRKALKMRDWLSGEASTTEARTSSQIRYRLTTHTISKARRDLRKYDPETESGAVVLQKSAVDSVIERAFNILHQLAPAVAEHMLSDDVGVQFAAYLSRHAVDDVGGSGVSDEFISAFLHGVRRLAETKKAEPFLRESHVSRDRLVERCTALFKESFVFVVEDSILVRAPGRETIIVRPGGAPQEIALNFGAMEGGHGDPPGIIAGHLDTISFVNQQPSTESDTTHAYTKGKHKRDGQSIDDDKRGEDSGSSDSVDYNEEESDDDDDVGDHDGDDEDDEDDEGERDEEGEGGGDEVDHGEGNRDEVVGVEGDEGGGDGHSEEENQSANVSRSGNREGDISSSTTAHGGALPSRVPLISGGAATPATPPPGPPASSVRNRDHVASFGSRLVRPTLKGEGQPHSCLPPLTATAPIPSCPREERPWRLARSGPPHNRPRLIRGTR